MRRMLLAVLLVAAAGAPAAAETISITLPQDKFTLPPGPGADVTQSARQKQTRYTIEERFSDFKATEGLPAYEICHSLHRGAAERGDECV